MTAKLTALFLFVLAASGVGAVRADASSDLQLTLAPPSNGFVVGSSAAFVLTVHNYGPEAVTGTTTVTDTLPAGLTPVSASGTDWACSAGQTMSCTTTATAAAGQALPQIALTATAEVAGLPSVTDSATVVNAVDPNVLNDTSTVSVSVRQPTDVGITVTHGGGIFNVGSLEQISLTASNAGTSETGGLVTVTDVLPDSLSFVSATGKGWTCALASGAAGHVVCTSLESVAASPFLPSFPEIKLAVRPTLAAVPAVINTGSVASEGDQYAANDSATDTIPVRVPPPPPPVPGPPDLGLNIAHSGRFLVGHISRFWVSVTHTGRSTHAPTTISVSLPNGFPFVSATATGWTCSSGQRFSCTKTGSTGTIYVNVKPTAAAMPVAKVDATLSNVEDSNAGNNGITESFKVDRLAAARFTARFTLAAAPGADDPTLLGRLVAVRIPIGMPPEGTMLVRCTGGCGGRLFTLVSGKLAPRHHKLRLHLRQPFAIRANTRLALIESGTGYVTRIQRYRFVVSARGGLRPRLVG